MRPFSLLQAWEFLSLAKNWDFIKAVQMLWGTIWFYHLCYIECITWGKVPVIPHRGVGGWNERKLPWEEHQYFLERHNQRNTMTCMPPKTSHELVVPVFHTWHSKYATASSSHICFTVLFLSVFLAFVILFWFWFYSTELKTSIDSKLSSVLLAAVVLMQPLVVVAFLFPTRLNTNQN